MNPGLAFQVAHSLMGRAPFGVVWRVAQTLLTACFRDGRTELVFMPGGAVSLCTREEADHLISQIPGVDHEPGPPKWLRCDLRQYLTCRCPVCDRLVSQDDFIVVPRICVTCVQRNALEGEARGEREELPPGS